MAAYFVLMQSTTSTGTAISTCPGVRPLLKKHGAEVLVAGFDSEAAEGDPRNSTVVIRFDDTAAAWGFLNDPGYQPVKEIPHNDFRLTNQTLAHRTDHH